MHTLRSYKNSAAYVFMEHPAYAKQESDIKDVTAMDWGAGLGGKGEGTSSECCNSGSESPLIGTRVSRAAQPRRSCAEH